jgi:Voltage gated chloride channel
MSPIRCGSNAAMRACTCTSTRVGRPKLSREALAQRLDDAGSGLPAHFWDVSRRIADLRIDALGRPLLRRTCRIHNDTGDTQGTDRDEFVSSSALCMQANRHLGELWFRFVGRHLFAVVFMGATLRGAFAALSSTILPGLPISVPAFAMVGMGAMVGSTTGAALTAVAMIFEMTLDYNIVLPMILAVAVGLGVRRVLSRENIYTMKLVRRGHHANMFMVRSAREAMDTTFMLIDEATSFEEFVRRPVNPVVWVTWW